MAVEHVPRGTRGKRCGNCWQAERRPGQGYCRKCHAAAQKAYRDRLKERRRTEAWELARLRLAVETGTWEKPHG